MMFPSDFYFNSHTREGVTTHTVLLPLEPEYFNSHTREGVTWEHFQQMQ